MTKGKPAALSLVFLALSAVGAAQESSLCDPGLEDRSSSPLAYRLRGQRCEGIYALQVSRAHIRLASLIETLEVDPQKPEDLTVTWSRPAGSGEVRLRAGSLRSSVRYRMDTAVAAGADRFLWPLDVLAALDLGRDEIGVLGWAAGAREGTAERVYLPVRAAQSGVPASAAEIAVALVPDVRLEEIFLTLSEVTEGGPGGVVFSERPAGLGYYPAGEAAVLSIEKPPVSGLYRLDLACRILEGGSLTESFLIYLET